MSPIRKAIFPVAGLGTRFLPATKAMPKEMLTVVDRPIIQHVVDEAREAGIEHFIFVTGRNKGIIEDHFDRQFELEFTLNERGKKADLEVLNRDLPEVGTTSFTRQQTPLGLGHAVWCARELVGREPFALLLPDVLVQAPRGCLSQMMDAYRGLGERANLIAVEEVPADRTHMYGVVGVGERKGKAFSITGMVEKPPRGSAPSNLIITGRYILQPEIFEILETQDRGAGGEIQITDAMMRLALKLPFYGFKFEGPNSAPSWKSCWGRRYLASRTSERSERRSGTRAPSALQPQADQDRGRGVVRARDIGPQPGLAQLSLELHGARQLVNQPERGRVTLVLPVEPDVFVKSPADLEGAEQPAPECVIDFDAGVAPEQAGDTGLRRFVRGRARGELHRGQPGRRPDQRGTGDQPGRSARRGSW